jgi:hypothetical protein
MSGRTPWARQLAAVDHSVVEHHDQGPGAFAGAELIEQGNMSVERVVGLVCARRRRRTGSKTPSIPGFSA